MKTFLKIILAVFLLLVCRSFYHGIMNYKQNKSSSITAVETNAVQNPEVFDTNKAHFTQVAHWEGKSTKNTETFHISSIPWVIIWGINDVDSKYAMVHIVVYTADGKIVDSFTGGKSDSTILRRTGNFYLKIDCVNTNYVISVGTLKENK
jgi:hypothetical protein